MISNNSWKQLNSNLLIDKKTSTDMNNPEILYDNNAIYENYDNLSAEYYYKGTSYADYYYLIWLNSESASINYNLYLYEDSLYTNLIKRSETPTPLDWIIYRPSATNDIYLKVNLSNTGFGFIEMEKAHRMNINNFTQIQKDLGSSELCEIAQVYLAKGKHYIFTLTFPSNCNFDLYMFNLLKNKGGICYEALAVSNSTITGQSERIEFISTKDDYFAFVIVREDGSGQFTFKIELYTQTQTQIPAFELLWTVISIIPVIYLIKHNSTKKNKIN